MRRLACRERDDWQAMAEASGVDFHTTDGARYRDERAFYAFTLAEIEDRIEAPTGEIDAMCLELCDRVAGDEQHLKRKPLLSREGANIVMVRHGDVVAEQPGPYGAEGFIRPRWRRCRISPANIRCSEAGSSITCRADYRSARTIIPSQATRRAFCRTRSFRASSSEVGTGSREENASK